MLAVHVSGFALVWFSRCYLNEHASSTLRSRPLLTRFRAESRRHHIGALRRALVVVVDMLVDRGALLLAHIVGECLG